MIQPYLQFNGNCEEAFKFYAECFGGKVVTLSRLNNISSNPVMHSQVELTESGGSVSGADTDKPFQISGMSILVFLPRERIDEIAVKLSEGGTLVSAFAPVPPPDDNAGGAEVLDRYGYTWFLSASCSE
jgi:PhnB protein